jgi:transposase
LSATQVSAADLAQLLGPVSRGELKPVVIWRRDEETGRREKIGEGFEYTVTLTAEHDGKEITWEERRLVVCSLSFAQAQKKGLDQRLSRAAAEIRRLNQRKQGKKELKTEAEYRAAVEKILTSHRVSGLLEVDYLVKRKEQKIRAWKNRPARVKVTETWSVRVRRDQAAIQAAKELLGWRVYATNAPEEKLSLTKAVLIYRGSPQIERGFRRLKGPLSLTPLYLETTTRLTGLVRLLLIGLRVLGLVEYKVRRSLAAKGEKIAGLTKGLPKKATARPTTESILQAFEGVTLSRLGDIWYLTPLSALQKQLLELLGFSQGIYQCLVLHFSEVPTQMSET